MVYSCERGMSQEEDTAGVVSKYFGDVDVNSLRNATPCNGGGDTVARILLSAPKQDLLNVFVDRMHCHGEVSERMYHLSGEVIVHVNSSDYSAWEWRWKCFIFMNEKNGTDAANLVYYEKEMMRSVATSNPKNYQLWNHRRKLAGVLGPSCLRDELAFTKDCLDFDAKNYHAWAHRQAMLRSWASSVDITAELQFSSDCLERDILNNSAWTQRAFVLNLEACQISIMDEIEYSKSQIVKYVENEAAWAYFKHLALYGASTQKHVEIFLAFCSQCLQEYPCSIEAVSAVFEYYKLVVRQLEQHGKTGCQEKIRVCKQKLASIRKKMVDYDPLSSNRFII